MPCVLFIVVLVG